MRYPPSKLSKVQDSLLWIGGIIFILIALGIGNLEWFLKIRALLKYTEY